MAIVDVQVPQFSESVSEGTLLTWKKKPGEAVTVDETLVEIETDKVVLEVPAPSSGVMSEILVAEDTGQLIDTILHVDPDEARDLGRAARACVLRHHTGDHRALEL